MFSLIQFSDSCGGTVSLVNRNWVTPRKTEVYWPPGVKGSKAFDHLLVHQVSPDVNKWKRYGIKKIFYETDDINKAKTKLKLAEETSDVQTEEEQEINKDNRKRKHKQTKRLISSDDDSNDDDNEGYHRPPPLKKTSLNKLQASSTQNFQEKNAEENTTLIFSNSFPEVVQDKEGDILCKLGTTLPSLSNGLLEGLQQETVTSEENNHVDEVSMPGGFKIKAKSQTVLQKSSDQQRPKDSTIEPKTIGNELVKKWKAIKDNFAKYEKKIKDANRSGAGSAKIKEYHLYKQLQFLKKVSQNATDSSINIVEGDSENHNEKTALPRYESRSRKRKAEEKDDFEENILKILKTPESRHLHFFKGILPTLQSLNEHQTLVFQSRVLQIQTDIVRPSIHQYTPHGYAQKIMNIRAIIKDIQLRDTIALFRVATKLLLLDVRLLN